MTQKPWRGCFISESLEEPMILNDFHCSKIYITEDGQNLDENGSTGRWHTYWIETASPPVERFQSNMKYNWYGHFWNGTTILAIFQNRTFQLDRCDKTTWREAVDYGLSQGIPEEQLDFLIDED